MAYDKLDTEGNDSVSLETMTNCYNASKHPHVISRRKSPEEVFDIFCVGMSLKSENGTVARAGFVDYYADINFCVPAERETYFVDLITKTWQIVSDEGYVSNERIR